MWLANRNDVKSEFSTSALSYTGTSQTVLTQWLWYSTEIWEPPLWVTGYNTMSVVLWVAKMATKHVTNIYLFFFSSQTEPPVSVMVVSFIKLKFSLVWNG